MRLFVGFVGGGGGLLKLKVLFLASDRILKME